MKLTGNSIALTAGTSARRLTLEGGAEFFDNLESLVNIHGLARFRSTQCNL